MIHYEILKFPDKRLKNISKDVLLFDEDHKKLVDLLISIMKSSIGCVGLSAPQINHHIRTIVFDVSNSKSKKIVKNSGLIVMNNPVIIKKQGEIITR